MTSERIGRGVVLAAALVSTWACATVDPWARDGRAAELGTAAADPSRTCDVEVLNATDRVLRTSLVADTQARSLGLIVSGQSIRFPVSCRLGRVTALGVSQESGGLSEGQRYRREARLDLLRATRLRLTQADQIR